MKHQAFRAWKEPESPARSPDTILKSLKAWKAQKCQARKNSTHPKSHAWLRPIQQFTSPHSSQFSPAYILIERVENIPKIGVQPWGVLAQNFNNQGRMSYLSGNDVLELEWRTWVAYLNRAYSILSSQWLTWIHSTHHWYINIRLTL